MENNTEMIEKNNSNLDALINKSITRRVRKELQNMYKLHHEVIVELIQNSSNFHIIVNDTKEGKKICYKFLINSNYPFVCPTVFFNNYAYKRLLVGITNYEMKNLRTLIWMDCFCCQSLTCSNNWSPGYMLSNIISEINCYKQLKRDITLKIIANIISRKYLVEDIKLDCWLFNY